MLIHTNYGRTDIFNSQELIRLLEEHKSVVQSQYSDYDHLDIKRLSVNSFILDGKKICSSKFGLGIYELSQEDFDSKLTSTESLASFILQDAYKNAVRHASKNESLTADMLIQYAHWISDYRSLLYSTNSDYRDSQDIHVFSSEVYGCENDRIRDYSAIVDICKVIKQRCKDLRESKDLIEKYLFSFEVHHLLWNSYVWLHVGGLISRFAMNYVQFQLGLAPTTIQPEHKSRYLQAIKDSHSEHSPKAFQQFMLMEFASNLRYEIDAQRLSHSLPYKLMSVYEAVKYDGMHNYAEYAELLQISEATVKRRLNELKQDGYIQRIGCNKTGHWVIL